MWWEAVLYGSERVKGVRGGGLKGDSVRIGVWKLEVEEFMAGNELVRLVLNLDLGPAGSSTDSVMRRYRPETTWLTG